LSNDKLSSDLDRLSIRFLTAFDTMEKHGTIDEAAYDKLVDLLEDIEALSDEEFEERWKDATGLEVPKKG
jgi:hypothetical protein